MSTSLVSLLFLLSLAAPCMSQDALRSELRGLAKEVGKFLTERGQTSIVVGEYRFKGQDPLKTSGTLIRQMLVEELGRLDPPVQSKPKAETTVSGTFRGQAGEASEPLTIVIESLLTDKLGTPLDAPVTLAKDLVRKVQNERTVLLLLQPAGTLPSGDGVKNADRKNAILDSLAKDTPHEIDGTEVFADKGSPYGIQILVNDKPVRPFVRDGEVFVKLARGDEYAVRLINRSPFKAAATLSIDSLNCFTFSELRNRDGEPLFNAFVLNERSNNDMVQGWFRDLKTVDVFTIQNYAKSAVGTLGKTGDLATIQVLFAGAWPLGEEPPAGLNEPKVRDRGLPDATARGRTIQQESTPVAVEVGRIRASICIRYETTPK